jgi:DNA-directed RNA polymerase specialized sigma24 family protein
MSEVEDSITHWFESLKAGDRAAAGPIWERYFARMLGLARASTLPGTPGLAAADEEDAVLSAFESFCAGAENGKFAGVNGREALWRLLAVITVRKVRAQRRRERRLKRGGGSQVLRESDLVGRGLDGLACLHAGPELAAQAAEELSRLLDVLDDDTLREVALWRLDGCTCDEIAARHGCARRTVARRLDVIRKLWSDVDPSARD